MLRRALTVAFAFAAVASGLPATAEAATKVERTQESASAQNDLLSLVNVYRANNGLQAVAPNGALAAAAGWMASDMAARNYIAHISSDGRSPTQRMAAFGYPSASMYTGEDLGAGYATASAIFSGWQASPAHNAVLLNPNYNAIGIGLAYEANSTYKWYWAADFGGSGGTVEVVAPPPAPQPQPLVRAATAPRGAAPQAAAATAPRGSEETVDPAAAAESAHIALIAERAARRIAHLLAVLLRIGAI